MLTQLFCLIASFQARKKFASHDFFPKLPFFQTENERRRDIRDATKMLISTITLYLAANALNFLITLLEHVNAGFLEAHKKFYTIGVDVTSLLAITCATSRFGIYYVCNAKVWAITLQRY